MSSDAALRERALMVDHDGELDLPRLREEREDWEAERQELTANPTPLTAQDNADLAAVDAEIAENQAAMSQMEESILAEGVIPGEWADLVYEASTRETTFEYDNLGIRYRIGARPHDAAEGRELTEDYGATEFEPKELAKLAKMLDELTGGQPQSSRSHPSLRHLPGQHNQQSHGNDVGVDVVPEGALKGFKVLSPEKYEQIYGDVIDEANILLDDGEIGERTHLTVRYFKSGDAHVALDLPGGQAQVMEEMTPDSMRALADDLEEILSVDLDELVDEDTKGIVADADSHEHGFYVARDHVGDVELHVTNDDGVQDHVMDLSEEDTWILVDALRAMADGYEDEFGGGVEIEYLNPEGARMNDDEGRMLLMRHLKGLHDQSSHAGLGAKAKKAAKAIADVADGGETSAWGKPMPNAKTPRAPRPLKRAPRQPSPNATGPSEATGQWKATKEGKELPKSAWGAPMNDNQPAKPPRARKPTPGQAKTQKLEPYSGPMNPDSAWAKQAAKKAGPGGSLVDEDAPASVKKAQAELQTEYNLWSAKYGDDPDRWPDDVALEYYKLKFDVEIAKKKAAAGGRSRAHLGLCTRAFDFELDGPSGDGRTLEGYAAVFNRAARIRDLQGDFDEVILPGAFTRSLRARMPVMQWDHGKDPAVGTAPIATIERLAEDSQGLHVRARLFTHPAVERIREAIAERAVTGMSFRFGVPKGGDKWSSRSGDVDLREVSEADTHELGPVVFPAYDATSVNLRGFLSGLDATELRSLVHELAGHLSRAVDLNTVFTGRPSARSAGGGDQRGQAPQAIPTSARAVHDALRLRGIIR